jgi:hypothetical protein
VDNFVDFNFIGVIIIILSEALQAKLYGCVAVFMCRAHALGSGRDKTY